MSNPQVIEVEADGVIYEFPAGTPREVMRSAMQKRLSGTKAAPAAAPRASFEQLLAAPQPTEPVLRPMPSLQDVAVGPEYGEPDPVQTEIKRLNLRIGELPVGTQTKAGTGLSEFEAYKTILGPNVEVRKIPTGPLEGLVVYRRPGEEQFTTVTDPNKTISAGRLAKGAVEFAPGVGGVAGSIGGGALGAFGGPGLATAGTIGGAGIGGATAEAARLIAGVKSGAIDLEKDATPKDLAVRAALAGGLEALGAAGGIMILRAVKSLFLRAGLPDPGNVDELFKEIQKRRDIVRQTASIDPAEAERLAGQMTTGRLTAETPVGKELLATEQYLEGMQGPAARTLTQRTADIEQTIGRLQESPRALGGREAATPESTGFVPPSVVGTQVEKTAPDALAATMQQMEKTAAQPAASAIATRTAAPQATPFIDPADVKTSEQLRSTLETLEFNLSRIAGDVIESAKQRGIALESLAPQTLSRLNAEVDRIQANLAQPLNEPTKNAVNAILRRLTPEEETVDPALAALRQSLGAPATKPPEPVRINYNNIEQTLRVIRQEEDAFVRGVGGERTVDQGVLRGIKKALIEDRNEALRLLPNGKKIVADLTAAEKVYAQVKQQFWEGRVRNYIAVNSKGGDAIADEMFVKRLLRDPAGAAEIARIFQTYGQTADRELVRSAMRWDLAKAAGAWNAKSARDVNQEALNNYIRDNQAVLQNFFSEKELAGFNNIAGWAQGIRRVLGVEGGQDPSKWFTSFYEAGNPQQAAAAMARFRRYDANNPGSNLADTVQAYVKNRIITEASEPKPDGTRVLDARKVLNILEAKDKSRYEWFASVMDKEFPQRLRQLANAVQIAKPDAPGKAAGRAQIEPGVEEAKRVLPYIFAPLTRAGTIVRRALLNFSESQREKVAKAMLDPEYYRYLVERGRITPGAATKAGAGGAAAASALADAIYERTENYFKPQETAQ